MSTQTNHAGASPLRGLIPDMSNPDYHAAEGVSSSQIKAVIDKSLLHYWHSYENPDREIEENPAFDIGTAIHTAVLEPDLLTSSVIQSPDFNLRSKDGRAERDKFLGENVGKIALSQDDYKTVLAIRDRVRKHPVAANLLLDGKAEQSFFAADPETGLTIKCRPDYLHDNGFAMIDVKSTKDASPISFAKDCANYHYDISVPWYFDVLDALYGEVPQHFIFLALEKKPPYAVGIYYAQSEDIQRARIAARRHFMRIVEAKQTNRWPDYGEEVLPLEMPGWVKR